MHNDKLKILIVDDERSNLEVLSRILKPEFLSATANYTLSVAKSGPAALKRVIDDKPDLILLDIVMPGMSGFEVLSKLRESETARTIPVIIITGLDSIQDEEKGFFLGAVDYITKPFHSSLVKARVKTHLRIVEQMRTIEHLGLMDVLTNIPNRRGFENRITTEWGRAIREKMPISLLIIDLDKFKLINDTYGHQQGDIVLQTIAKVLESTLSRHADFAARWGGEEFTVLLPDTELDGALTVAENIRANVEAAIIPDLRGASPIKTTVSIGAVSVSPSIDDAMQDFIEQADRALYHAKNTGRNNVCSLQAEGIYLK